MKKILYVLAIFSVFAVVLFNSSITNAESLSAPSYVSAYIYSSGSIRLNWDNNVAGATRFTIQRKTDSGSFTTVTTVSANTSTYNDTNISNGHTYVYRVFATKGSLSGYAAESNAVQFLYPTGLSAIGISDSEIELTWTYPYNNNVPETSFQTVIERRNEGSTTWNTIVTVPGTSNSFVDTNLSEATRYYYRIRTLTATSAMYLYYPNNTAGQRANTLLKAPTNVSARVISTQSIEITWTDNSAKESGYIVERKTGSGIYTRLKALPANATSYVDQTAVNGEQYTYRITAQSASYRGTPSAEVTVPFLFPVAFKIKDTYSTQITLEWEYPGTGRISPDNSIVLIERRESGSLYWQQIHVTKPGVTEYTDSNLKPGTRYYYRIRSRYNNDFTTEYFPSATGISDYTLLLLDTHFCGYALSDTEILLEWDEKAIGSNTVVLEKLGDTGTFITLARFSQGWHYIDTVHSGSTNSYRLKLSSYAVDSDYTPVINITAEQLPAVEKFSVAAILPERIFLTWEYGKAMESGFEIWRKSASEGIWKHIGTTSRGHLMYSDEDIQNGQIYTYRIRAVKSNTIFSAFTETNPVNVSFSEPDGKLTMSKSGDMLYLGWDDFSNMEQYYIVEYKTGINDIWHVLEKLPKNTSIYRFIPAQGVDYILRVRAYSEFPVFEKVSNVLFYSSKIPEAPRLLQPTIVGPKRIVLNWADLSGDEDGFVIYRKYNTFDNDFKAVGTVPANTEVFSDETVIPGQSYTYIVSSKNAAGESFPSNEIHADTPEQVLFTDIASYSWAQDAIEYLASMGTISGDGKGHFNPSGNITRAEFIKLLVATFSFPETPVGYFRDVNAKDWHHRWIMTAYRKGIVEPDENGMFYPNNIITRQDIVYFSYKAIKAAGLSLEQPPLYNLYKFKDYSQISGYARSAFASMHYAGIISGIGGDRLGPLNPATRAEAATIIYRMIQVLESRSQYLH
jgi:hypothetical protein